MKKSLRFSVLLIAFLFNSYLSFGQITLKGSVVDGETGDPLIGATLFIIASGEGTSTDFDGAYVLKTTQPYPFTVEVSYTGFSTTEYDVLDGQTKLDIKLGESAITIAAVEVKGQRISDKQKAAPLTVETLDILAIKETPSENFYDGLGALKGVDLTAASLGFKVINMRGFNSTSPVRSLQIIDGVDNQAPGLNFSLGNFLGSSELDVLKVDLVQGASSAYYGPNAFNGVIAMETKNPFFQKGLAASVKLAERNMLKTELRYGNAVKNSEGVDWMAYKFNLSYFQADDWVANNNNAVDGSETATGNPGGWDKVNVYGDEYQALYDLSDSLNFTSSASGLNTFHRQGYNEEDLVDYGTENFKANMAFYFRLNPEAEYESPELIISSNFGSGTTVYQGDNRFSLRDILFFQNRIEIKKRDKYFVRAYATHEDAGNSYDPYFTALRLQELNKSNELWQQDYIRFWQGGNNIYNRMKALEYPEPTIDFTTSPPSLVFDYPGARQWFADNQDSLAKWHSWAAEAANAASIQNEDTNDFYVPGTERFQTAFDSITSLKNNEGGTRFFDKSALYHVQGEYIFTPKWTDKLKVGASSRLYTPVSEGTVFSDSVSTIRNFEYGVYAGLEKKFGTEWILTATGRVDKNQNFDYLFTPAASIVYSPSQKNYLRLSFSQGVRNPTLTDQYLNLNVGRATLLGNLNGFKDLYSVESVQDHFKNGRAPGYLKQFDIDPVRPERVRTVELGYRTTLFNQLYIDASYYYNVYNDFIGYNIGIDADFDVNTGFANSLDVYRVAANSINEVTTQGAAIGANYYFADYFQVSGNYSWNRLNVEFPDDPIIPAFNTPENKYNIGFSARNMPVDLGFSRLKSVGFNFNYKWVEGFLFEGSPQFTGLIPSYGLLDGQVNVYVEKIHSTFKLGASNILNNKVFQTYGGPRVGRLAYLSVVYNFEKK